MARMGPVRQARAASRSPAMATRLNFGAQLRAFAEKTEVTLDEALRGIVIELFSSVIMGTPVDTGRARGNWQTSVGSPSNGVLDREGAAAALAELESTTVKMGSVVWLANNLPYIARLEYEHWSAQAPNGMVRKNMARVNRIVDDVVKGKPRP